MSDLGLTRALRAFDAMTFVTKHGGRKESSSAQSHEYLLTCPLCGGHNLRWNPTRQDGVGGWKCWNCGVSGNTLYLIQLMERLGLQSAVAYVMGTYHGGDAELELKDVATIAAPQLPKRERLSTMPWPAYSVDAREHPHVRAYLHGRGIDDTMISDWKIHAGTSGREKNFAIFPVFMDGGLVYWQARAAWDPPPAPPELSREDRKAWVRAWIKLTHYRKTLNPKNQQHMMIRQATAGEVLFNYDRAARSPHVVICEGPVDAIKVGPHAVALFGKGTDEKLDRLRRMTARRYTVYLDRGADEERKAKEIASALSGWAEVFVAVPPEGFDAGALTPAQNAAVIEQAVPAGRYQLTSNLKP